METFRFASFSLNAATRQLLCDGREVSLSPKSFQLLLLLVINRHRAMSKGELHQSLWPSTFVVDTNLASLVAEIRRVLEDDAFAIELPGPKQAAAVESAHSNRMRHTLCMLS